MQRGAFELKAPWPPGKLCRRACGRVWTRCVNAFGGSAAVLCSCGRWLFWLPCYVLPNIGCSRVFPPYCRLVCFLCANSSRVRWRWGVWKDVFTDGRLFVLELSHCWWVIDRCIQTRISWHILSLESFQQQKLLWLDNIVFALIKWHRSHLKKSFGECSPFTADLCLSIHVVLLLCFIHHAVNVGSNAPNYI